MAIVTGNRPNLSNYIKPVTSDATQAPSNTTTDKLKAYVSATQASREVLHSAARFVLNNADSAETVAATVAKALVVPSEEGAARLEISVNALNEKISKAGEDTDTGEALPSIESFLQDNPSAKISNGVVIIENVDEFLTAFKAAYSSILTDLGSLSKTVADIYTTVLGKAPNDAVTLQEDEKQAISFESDKLIVVIESNIKSTITSFLGELGLSTQEVKLDDGSSTTLADLVKAGITADTLTKVVESITSYKTTLEGLTNRDADQQAALDGVNNILARLTSDAMTTIATALTDLKVKTEALETIHNRGAAASVDEVNAVEALMQKVGETFKLESTDNPNAVK